jgi:hypothetical protein
MAKPARKPSLTSYERDFAAWSGDQARLLRSRSAAGLDWDNLAEEIESLGRSERHEISNRLLVLLHHLLKWAFQPEGRCNSWSASMLEQRMRIAQIIRDNPSLRGYPAQALDDEYRLARLKAAGETGIAPEAFPARAPYTIAEILDETYLPEPR